MSAPKNISLSCIVPALSSEVIGKVRCMMMRPVSMAWERKNVVTPGIVSPLIMAQFIGAAPRYCGRSEACKLNVPNRGMFHTTSGSMRNATTIWRSAFHSRKAFKKFSSFSFSGWRSGRFWDKAYCLTGENCILWPLPAGLSGMVMTPTIL